MGTDVTGEDDVVEQNQEGQFPRTIDVRGEVEISIRRSIVKSEKDTVNSATLVLSITDGEDVVEGNVVLSPAKVKRFLKLLNLKVL